MSSTTSYKISVACAEKAKHTTKITGHIWDGGVRGVYDVRFNYIILENTKDYENAHVASLLLKQYGTEFGTNPTTGQARAKLTRDGLKKLQEACAAHLLGVGWTCFTDL
jgi:hypothetical protein